MQAKIKPATIAKAVLIHIQSDNQLCEKWLDLLKGLSILISDPLMKRIIRDPNIPSATIVSLCSKILKAEDTSFLQFLAVAIKYQILLEAKAISSQFEKLLHERSGTANVTICTASKVTKQNQKQLLKTIEEIFGVEHIKPEFVVDTSLISGYKATCRDKVYNASMLGQLKTVHQSLIYQ